MKSFKRNSSPIATKKSKKPLQEGISLSPSDFIVDLTAIDGESIFANDIAEYDDEVILNLKMKK